jgi:hypothetical protein
MGKLELSPQLVGMVARKISDICKDEEITLKEAFHIYMDGISKNMAKYDIQGQLKEIITSAYEKLPPKAKAHAKGGSASTTNATPKSKDLQTVMGGELPKPKPKLAKPLAIRVKGSVDLEKDGDGYKVKRTPKTKKVSLFCPEGTTGKKLDDDTAGCVFDDQY